jgi:hypothetical protein
MSEKLMERRRLATVQPSATLAIVDKRTDPLVIQLVNAAATTSQPLAEVPEPSELRTNRRGGVPVLREMRRERVKLRADDP